MGRHPRRARLRAADPGLRRGRATSSIPRRWRRSTRPRGSGPYAVSKHGVLALSDVLRAELAAMEAPVGVSVVMPGMIKTGMNPLGTVSAETVAANIVDAIRQRPRPPVRLHRRPPHRRGRRPAAGDHRRARRAPPLTAPRSLTAARRSWRWRARRPHTWSAARSECRCRPCGARAGWPAALPSRRAGGRARSRRRAG